MFCRQLSNALWKNWTLKRRSKCCSICEMLVPLFVVAMIVLGYALSARTKVDANNYNQIVIWPQNASGLEDIERFLNSMNQGFNSSSSGRGISWADALVILATNPQRAATFAAQYTGQLNSINISKLPKPAPSTWSNFSSLLCGMTGLCFTSTQPGNLTGMDSYDLQGIVPVLPFDLYILIKQAAIKIRDVRLLLRQFSDVLPCLEDFLKPQRLAFAPDTPEVRALVDALNTSTFFFNTMFYDIFSTENDALTWAKGPGEDQLWALIVVNTVDTSTGTFDYTIRMNRTATPTTRETVDPFIKGRGSFHQSYICSGFSTLQHLMDDYFMGLVGEGQALGSQCPAPVPGASTKSLFSAPAVNTSLNITWVSETIITALIQMLPRNISALVPGLMNPITGEVSPSAVHRIQHLFSSPAGAASLVLPVQDYDQNDFWLFASAFIGLAGVYAYLFPVSVNMRYITQEKEMRIKQGMLIMGLGPMALYLSWVITLSVTALITGLFITIEMQFSFFKKSDFSMILVMNLLFALSAVAFAMMCGTFFNKARNAAIVGPLLLFATTIPIFAIPDGTSKGAKIGISILSPVAYSWGLENFASYEFIGSGMQWSNVREGDYSVATSMILLTFDVCLYFFLAWYLDQILPSSYGVRRSCCFCLPECVRRWFRCHRHKELDAAVPVDPELLEKLDPETEAILGIEIMGLSKVFKSLCRPENVAVNGLSLNIYENQISVILGHNGAGKSTTINMLTGILPVTSGDCFVYGMSIRHQMKKIRRSLGLCPQHDILWPKLTVKEHLQFYAKLKGLHGAEVDDAVNNTIRDIGLDDKVNAWSSTLSGGMKRRLSVGIALIGGSKVVFLDEPTSGMDPVARRHTWDLLRRAKAGRVVVLTTHFMDEADILGDTIAIMSRGKLQCSGSPLFLKSRLGAGYNISFDLAEDANRQAIHHTIMHHIPSAEPLSEVAAECQFKLPMSEAPQFPSLFTTLESHSVEWGIESFGLSITTIEEVFLKIAQQDEDEMEPEARKHRWARFHHRKRDALTQPETKVVEMEMEHSADSEHSEGSETHNEPNPADSQSSGLVESHESLPSSSTVVSEAEVGLSKSPKTFGADPFVVHKPSAVAAGLLVKGQQKRGVQHFFSQVGISLRKRFLCIRHDRKTICLQTLMPVAVITLALLILSIRDPQRPALELSMGKYGRKQPPPELVVRECGWAGDAQYWTTPAVYDIQDVQNSLQLSNYTYSTYFHHVNDVYRAGGVVYKDTVLYLQLWSSDLWPQEENLVPVYATTFLYNSTALHGYPTQYAELNKARLQKMTQNPGSDLRVTNHPLPLTNDQQNRYNAIITVVAALFVLIPFTFFPANCVAFIVKEREVRAKHLQMLSGLQPAAYWLAAYIFDNLSMLITTSLTLIVFAIFGRSDLVGSWERVIGVILLFILYGFSSIALGYLCSFPFKNHSLAQNVLMIVFFLFGFVLVLISRVLDSIDSAEAANWQLQKVFRIIPPYCLGEGIISMSLINVYGYYNAKQYEVFGWDVLGRDLCYMGVLAPVFFLGVLLVDSDFFSQFKDKCRRRFGTCCAKSFWCCCCVHSSDSSGLLSHGIAEEDDDVAKERLAVEEGEGRPGDKVTVQHLTKVYPKRGKTGPKTAVDDLSFGVPSNEIFALLGSNGAGKTTTMGVLSGEFLPTSGQVLLNGFDIQRQKREAQRNIGYCPQFDALLDHLSVIGHLTLYGKLRGVPGEKLDTVVDSIMDYLGLIPHQYKPAAKLSGGNKRKLSIGIAIIGSPDVLFLDEPSTGLDPVSRRALWTCISDLAENRSIILTTHHLEEVDALAHRVTIMLHGHLRCLGTLQHLKSKFGDGYTLQFRVPAAQQPQLGAHLESQFPNIVLEEDSFGRMVYHLPRMENGQLVKLSEIFSSIQEVAPSLGITDYSVSQTTLQDVFLRLSAEADEEGLGARLQHPSLHHITVESSEDQCLTGDVLTPDSLLLAPPSTPEANA